MEAVYWYNATPKDNVLPLTAAINLIHRYRIRLKGTDVPPLDKPKQQQIRYDVGDWAWMKTPNGRCTSPYARGHVTGVISSQNVLVNGMPRHVRDLRPVIGLDTSERGSDSELSTQSARVITINEARGDPLEVNTAHVTVDTSADESFEEEVVLLRRSARRKRSTLVSHLCDHEIPGGGGVVNLKGRICISEVYQQGGMSYIP